MLPGNSTSEHQTTRKATCENLNEEFNNAKNKDIISDAEYQEFNTVFPDFRQAKGQKKNNQNIQSKQRNYTKRFYTKN